MSSLLPNADQRLMLAAIGRVLSRRAGRVKSPREALQLLRTLGRRAAPATEAQGPKVRKFWGWGYEGEGPAPLLVEVFLEFLKARLGLGELEEVPAPKLEAISLRPPRFELPGELAPFCSDHKLDRISHSRGKAFRDIVQGLRGQYDNPPDQVAYPRTEDEILALIRFCESEGLALVPYGGGSSVVGGVEPTRSKAYAGTLTLDLRHFDRVLEVDEVSRAARVQAGIHGPALEAALKPYGLSPRFYPQSFEFSTLGGWIATRAGGHYCTLYTHIDDIVEAVRVVTPRGIHQSRRLPASGAGPSPDRLWLGSEGALGIITEAWIRLHARPRHRSSSMVRFPDFLGGARAVRALSQSKLYPVNCRLVSRLEALSMGIGDGRHTMLLLGFESEHYPQKAELARAQAVCREHGGRVDRRSVKHRSSGSRSSASGGWRENFLKAPYLRDILAARGLVTETFETAVTWDGFEAFHQSILEAARAAFEVHCEGRGLITCRFTHIYPDGPAPYYTVVADSEPGRQVETWDAIKAAVSNAILESGGTITHHHAVGRDHRPWYAREQGPLFEETLKGLKSTLDPGWILNPGVLLGPPN